MIQTIYREHTITYNEGSEIWETQVAERSRRSQNLKSCKEAIDKYLDAEDKVKKKFDRFDAIKHGGYGEIFPTITITSITDTDTIWATDAKGNREKISGYSLRSVYVKNDANIEVIKNIKSVRAEIKAKEAEEERLVKTLEILDVNSIFKSL